MTYSEPLHIRSAPNKRSMFKLQCADGGKVKSAQHDMQESQRALELRKFFAPDKLGTSRVEREYNDTLNNDGALDAYAETILWRVGGVHAMISLIDQGTQYFLAGALRADEGEMPVLNVGKWFGCSMVGTSGGLCENTITVPAEDEYPCFVVPDLSKDNRFRNLAVVNGTIASYRFYAGMPITTDHGINIGSFFVFDTETRDDLTLYQKKFMYQQAANVMKHLEMKREATERRRLALMSQGIAQFLERDSGDQAEKIVPAVASREAPKDREAAQTAQKDFYTADASKEDPKKAEKKDTGSKETILDKIRVTLDHAARILRDSLELNVGGVVFLDTAIGYSEIENTDAYLDRSTDVGASVQDIVSQDQDVHQRTNANGSQRRRSQGQIDLSKHFSKQTTRTSVDKHRAAKILAVSTADAAKLDSDSSVIDTKSLQAMVGSYPKGNVWYIDQEGYFSSLEQVNKLNEMRTSNAPASKGSTIDVSKQQAEANVLTAIFRKARQIIFLPLWEAGGDRWFSGCFIWSQSAWPVFTVDSDLAYLSAFTNSLMVEISRLDAITSSKMKSDFISSISHEFRSPLHGILASAEFLRDSEPDASQLEFISTIQNCGGTLLDTINHVLDYSKINSFEKTGNQQGTISNELYQSTNLALLCEDIVNGMIAAREYRVTGHDSHLPETLLPATQKNESQHKPVEIIIDIENRDWTYVVQPGALRRVVMNIFGNAQKYTEAGFILVQLKLNDTPSADTQNSSGKTLLLRIRDSGRGMSSEYMERKLYHPFAQEDSFAPGVGLGLSIVWSIVNQLGGKIAVRSDLGKGTDIEITIPVEKTKENFSISSQPSGLSKVSQDAQDCLSALQERAVGKTIRIVKRHTEDSTHSEEGWKCVQRYCSDWYKFTVTDTQADIVITDSRSIADISDQERVLLIHDELVLSYQNDRHRSHSTEHISQPVAPFKFARALLNLMDQDLPTHDENRIDSNRSDAGTQTPLGSPEERTILNGLIAVDYGFSSAEDQAEGLKNTANKDPKAETPSRPGSSQTHLPRESSPRLNLSLPPSRKFTPSPQPITSLQSTLANFKLAESQKTSKSPKEPQPPTTSLHILAVDDNDLNLQLLKRYLMKRKSDIIVTARNGLEAVDAVKATGPQKKFDIIFMDISMPEMNGFEATRVIRAYERDAAHGENDQADSFNEKTDVQEERGRAYVVALTGLASRRDRDEADESGFDDFLTKPISFGKIGELLKRLSEQKVTVV